MSERNWRNEIDAQDYFGHQKKQLQFADRRPVIRKAADLVGPGISANATRLDDYNDVLATFDGYYSSVPGALNAPNAVDSFVGAVSGDNEIGGVQTFTNPATGQTYQRTFTRAVLNPATIYWTPWVNVYGGDSDWIELGVAGNPDFISGWEAYPGGFAPPAFMKRNGIVYLRGLIRSGSINSAAFFLPEGFRPANRVLMATISNAAIGRVTAYPTGEVSPESPSSDVWVSLDGLSFPHDGG